MTSPRIRVIIATCSRASLLDECLRHLAVQRFHAGDEVIVVDNASVDDTPEVVRTHQANFPTTLQLLHEPQPGKSHALARALSSAAGDVLAFLDDDVNVDSAWLNVVRDTMRDPSLIHWDGQWWAAGTRYASNSFGLYVSDGKKNATLREGLTAETLTLEQAVEMLAEKKAKKRR